MTKHAFPFVGALIILAAAVHAEEKPMGKQPPPLPCKPEMKTCEFWLHVRAKLTMVHSSIMTVPSNGKIYYVGVENMTQATPVNMSDVLTADGYQESRLLYLVNDTLPGPTLTVYHGQEVKVHIFNHLMEIAISMHFHGLVQMGTPWSDGVGFVTQCPILPGSRFTHKFKITQPGGTYWYHAHVGSQRTMGMYGAFIIKNKPPLPAPEPEEHVLLLQDYNHDWDSEMGYYKMLYGMYDGTKKLNYTDSQDGGHFSNFHFHAGLINGRGRYYDPELKNKHNGAPLSNFKVKKGNNYRFRIIGAGNVFPFRVSVDDHQLMVVATDGFDVEPMAVESFIINPGERFDFMLEANQAVANYMIRAQTLEVGFTHVAEAILNYEGVEPDMEPKTQRRVCTESKPCKVLNCPFLYYPKSHNTECILLEKLRGTEGDAPKAESSSFKQFFLNFAFPGNEWTPGSVNGRTFHHPTVSALTQMDEMEWGCDPEKCGEEKVCSCIYHVDLEYGDTVQMVFMNLGVGKGWGHPIHLHGHSFYVVKQGFAQSDNISGTIQEDNLDIDCGGPPDRHQSFCNAARWADKTWVGDDIPGMNLERPPLKDTVIVPTGSYVIIRFKADNPGVWIMHCHIEIHNLDGMTMLVREAKDMIPKAPKNFPTCGNFMFKEPLNSSSEEDMNKEKNKDNDKKKDRDDEKEKMSGDKEKMSGDKTEAEPTAMNYRDAFWACAGVLIGIVVTFVVSSVAWLCCCRRRREKPNGSYLSGNTNVAFQGSTSSITAYDAVKF